MSHNSNDVYNQILKLGELLDVDRTFSPSNDLDFSTSDAQYDPTDGSYSTGTTHTFEIKSVLEDEYVGQFLVEYDEYFRAIRVANEASPILTDEELAKLKNLLIKRSSFTNQFKGTTTSIELVLGIFSNAVGHYLISADPDPYSNFVYRISTDLPRDMWLRSVKSIVHPNGWGDKHILIVPDIPSYFQKPSDDDLRRVLSKAQVSLSYLEVDWDSRLKRNYYESAAAALEDLQTHYYYGFKHYEHEVFHDFDSSLYREVVHPSSRHQINGTSSNGRYHELIFDRTGIALEYEWFVYRDGVLYTTATTNVPKFVLTGIHDDSSYIAHLVLKRGDWTLPAGIFVIPSTSVRQPVEITTWSGKKSPLYSSARAHDEVRWFDSARVGDFEDSWRLGFSGSQLDGAFSDDWMNEPMSLVYSHDEDFSSNVVTLVGPAVARSYEWTVLRNLQPYATSITSVPWIDVATAAWETEPETFPGSQLFDHPGRKSMYTVSLTVVGSSTSKIVGSVDIGTMPDVTPPLDMTFGVAPGAHSNQTSVEFIPAANPDIAAFVWRLDGGSWSQEQNAGVNFFVNGLADGWHTIEWKARDAAYNWTGISSYSWLVDTVASNVVLSGVPTITNSRAATIVVSDPRADVATYTWRLNGGSWSPQTQLSIPIVLGGLTDGVHTLEVIGRDLAGNDQTTPTSASWTVDNIAPIATLTRVSPSPTNQTTFKLSVGNPDVVSYRWYYSKLDPVTLTPTWTSGVSAPTPVSQLIEISGLTDGTYRAFVYGTDAAGNEYITPTASSSWIIDTVKPLFSLSGVPAYTNKNFSFNVVSVSEYVGVQYRVDGGPLIAGGPYTYSNYQVSISSMSQGSHLLEVFGTDLAGNVSDAVTATFVVDTIPPVVNLSIDVPSFTKSRNVNATFTGSGDLYKYTWRLDGGIDHPNNLITSPLSFTNLADGHHTLIVWGFDQAGNQSTASAVGWDIDTVAPIATFVSGGPVSLTNQRDYSITIGPSTTGEVYTYSWQLDGGSWSAYTSRSIPLVLTQLLDGPHTLNVKGQDEAGNTQTTPTTVTWQIQSSSVDATWALPTEFRPVCDPVLPYTYTGQLRTLRIFRNDLTSVSANVSAGGLSQNMIGAYPYQGFVYAVMRVETSFNSFNVFVAKVDPATGVVAWYSSALLASGTWPVWNYNSNLVIGYLDKIYVSHSSGAALYITEVDITNGASLRTFAVPATVDTSYRQWAMTSVGQYAFVKVANSSGSNTVVKMDLLAGSSVSSVSFFRRYNNSENIVYDSTTGKLLMDCLTTVDPTTMVVTNEFGDTGGYGDVASNLNYFFNTSSDATVVKRRRDIGVVQSIGVGGGYAKFVAVDSSGTKAWTGGPSGISRISL